MRQKDRTFAKTFTLFFQTLYYIASLLSHMSLMDWCYFGNTSPGQSVFALNKFSSVKKYLMISGPEVKLVDLCMT